MKIKQTSVGTIILLSRPDLKHWKSNIPVSQIQLSDFYSTDFSIYFKADYIIFNDYGNVNHLLKSRSNEPIQEIIDLMLKEEQKEKNRIEEIIVI